MRRTTYRQGVFDVSVSADSVRVFPASPRLTSNTTFSGETRIESGLAFPEPSTASEDISRAKRKIAQPWLVRLQVGARPGFSPFGKMKENEQLSSVMGNPMTVRRLWFSFFSSSFFFRLQNRPHSSKELLGDRGGSPSALVLFVLLLWLAQGISSKRTPSRLQIL
jgi:hypothetical protein